MLRPNKKPQMIRIAKPKIFENIASEDKKRLKKYKSDKISDTISVSKIQLNSVNRSERIFFFIDTSLMDMLRKGIL